MRETALANSVQRGRNGARITIESNGKLVIIIIIVIIVIDIREAWAETIGKVSNRRIFTQFSWSLKLLKFYFLLSKG